MSFIDLFVGFEVQRP